MTVSFLYFGTYIHYDSEDECVHVNGAWVGAGLGGLSPALQNEILYRMQNDATQHNLVKCTRPGWDAQKGRMSDLHVTHLLTSVLNGRANFERIIEDAAFEDVPF